MKKIEAVCTWDSPEGPIALYWNEHTAMIFEDVIDDDCKSWMGYSVTGDGKIHLTIGEALKLIDQLKQVVARAKALETNYQEELMKAAEKDIQDDK